MSGGVYIFMKDHMNLGFIHFSQARDYPDDTWYKTQYSFGQYCPELSSHYDMCDEIALSYIDMIKPTLGITKIQIEYIDRGISNFEVFGKLFMKAYPNLKQLHFSQNYSYAAKSDTWKTLENMFINMDLDLLICDDMQSDLANIFNQPYFVDDYLYNEYCSSSDSSENSDGNSEDELGKMIDIKRNGYLIRTLI